MANNKPFKIKNGLSAKVYLQSSSALGASDVDVSAGSYFSKTLTANTTLTFSNPPASGVGSSFALEITGANVTVGYDITGMSTLLNESMAVDSGTNPPTGTSGFTVGNSGTRLYAVGTGTDTINQYSFSTAYDMSTLTNDGVSLALGSQDTAPGGVFFKPDGTSFYMVGTGSTTVHQYNLTTAWDLSTAGYASKTMSVSGQDSAPYEVQLSQDGTKCYVMGGSYGKIYQYTLTTAWDISTGSFASKEFAVTGGEDFEFSSDGTTFLIPNASTYVLTEYALTTAWDITTASLSSNTFTFPAQRTAISYSDDGAYLYSFGNSGNKYFTYSSEGSAPATVTYPSSVKWAGATAPDAPAAGEKDVCVFITSDGGSNYYGKQAGDAVA